MAEHHYEILPASIEHLRELAANLRKDDADELVATGVTVRKALWRGYRRSLWCQTALIDGQVAAVWGLNASPLGRHGVPWLLTSPAIELMPVAFLREAKKEVARMLRFSSCLENRVLATYGGAVRLLECLGFTIDPAEPSGRNGEMLALFRLER
jgi:hypothetical protein